MPATYKAVVFDLFGTLAQNYSHQESDQAVRQIACVLEVSYTEFVHLWRDTYDLRLRGRLDSFEANVRYIIRSMGVIVGNERLAAASQIRLALMRKALLPMPNVVETLATLREAGYLIGVVTNCPPPVPDLWPDTPFASSVGQAVFSCTERLVKPDPRIYGIACERLGVSPDECLYIGDGENNELTGAARVGMHPVLILAPDGGPSTPYSLKRDQWPGPSVLGVEGVLALL